MKYIVNITSSVEAVDVDDLVKKLDKIVKHLPTQFMHVEAVTYGEVCTDPNCKDNQHE